MRIFNIPLIHNIVCNIRTKKSANKYEKLNEKQTLETTNYNKILYLVKFIISL